MKKTNKDIKRARLIEEQIAHLRGFYNLLATTEGNYYHEMVHIESRIKDLLGEEQ